MQFLGYSKVLFFKGFVINWFSTKPIWSMHDEQGYHWATDNYNMAC